MSLLQFFFIISGIIILILAVDISKKQKFNALHFLVFLWVWWGLLLFSFFPWVLTSIWTLFGVARGADVLVYTSIIFLLYFVLLLLSKHVENKDSITSLIRELALESSEKKSIKWQEVFLIRSYNEAEVVEDIIKSIFEAWYKNILIVDDGSNDWSRGLFEKYKDKIFYIKHYKNRGAWAALETGFEYLRRYGDVEYIVTFDADWQHDVADFEKFLDEFKKDSSLWAILGSRFIKETNSNVPLVRKITLFLGRIFTSVVSWIYLTDAHNGYRAFTLETVQKIKLTIDSMAYASELLEEIKKKDIKFMEVPVNIKYTEYSLKKWQGSVNAVNIALRFIWNKFFR